MATLLRVLMLVACGPLVFPPGFCVCKASAKNCTPVQRKSVANKQAGLSSSHSTGSCSHHHNTSKSDTAASSPAIPTPPSPHHDHDHDPDCPAATASVEQLQWFEPTNVATPVMMQVAFVGVRLVPATGCRPLDHPDWPCAAPLYLKHCSLVI